MTTEENRLARNAKAREYQKEWRKLNLHKVKSYKQKDYQKRKEFIDKKTKEWRIAHPEYRKVEHIKRYSNTKHREKDLARSTQWAKEHPDRVAEIQARHYWNNRDERLLQNSNYRKSNQDKRLAYYQRNRENILASNKSWKEENPGRVAAMHARRRFLKRDALGAAANELLISVFYSMSKRVTRCLDIEHHVDHIIPLTRGGKHHQCNLQVIPGVINLRKNNKLDFRVFTEN